MGELKILRVIQLQDDERLSDLPMKPTSKDGSAVRYFIPEHVFCNLGKYFVIRNKSIVATCDVVETRMFKTGTYIFMKNFLNIPDKNATDILQETLDMMNLL